MTNNNGLKLIAPKITPVLDPGFRPAALATRAFRESLKEAGNSVSVGIAIEQADGSIFQFFLDVFPENHPASAGNATFLERFVKFLLWSRGGFRVHVEGPKSLAEALSRHYTETKTGRFDADIMGNRIYEMPFEVIHCQMLPEARETAAPLGRHLNGARIGFDLGGSDRKVAAILDGKCIFSEETVWDPVPRKDPQWHFDGIMDSLKRAAAHLPRVDAIGGSSAGVYVNNRVKVASLFRGVSPDLFQARVKDIFLEAQKAWGGIPFEVANDGEVTALAGSMSLGKNAVLGLALGTSTAGGYVNVEGNITTWLNELAFVPVDYNPNAPADEWSGDYGCGVQYFSQQCVGRLLAPAGIDMDSKLSLPEKLKVVQKLMEQGDYRAEKIYQTIGTYLGYGVAHFSDFYQIEQILILGRVTSGAGGALIVKGAEEVLKLEFPELAQQMIFHMPDEKRKTARPGHGRSQPAQPARWLKSSTTPKLVETDWIRS